jgi:hypothetical protein
MLPAAVEALLEACARVEDPATVSRLMSEVVDRAPEIQRVDNLVLACGPFRIERMLSQYAEGLVRALKVVEPLCLRSAPVLVRTLSLPKQECILVTTYPDTQSWPVPYDDASGPDKPGPEAGRHFLEEMEMLARSGWQHPYAARGTAHWLVSRETGGIVLEAWHTLTPADENERLDFIRKIRRLLGFQS